MEPKRTTLDGGQTIEFVEWRELPVFYVPKWWDRPRWWLVKVLGGKCPYDTVKIVRVPVNGKTFSERLFKQRRAIMDTFRREPTTLLIGAEDFEEIMGSPEIHQQFQFSSSFNYGLEIYGLTVKVIPWMRGAVVMPSI